MSKNVVLLSVPGLREKDVARMPRLRELTAGGEIADLVPGFPAVTCPVQAAMTTGVRPREHGVVGNGLFWRDRGELEMWTAPNTCVEAPQLWEVLRQRDAGLTSAVWFPMHAKECTADYVSAPAPIHNPDGSESLWCYTKPEDLYGTLLEEFGHFPLHHFWGPMANIKSSEWIVDSAIHAAKAWRPNLFYVYLPHLDYAAQKTGPDSPAAEQAVADLDGLLGNLGEGFRDAYGGEPLWIVAGEYAITPVSQVVYPNRVLREAGLLTVRDGEGGEALDPVASRAWALADHQFAHVFVRDSGDVGRVAELFRGREGVAEVLVGEDLARYGLDHPRSGDVVLVASPESWMAYYYWTDDARAPAFARSVDIHRKPGYDPVELFFDPATKSIPLDATLVQGSHGAPAGEPSRRSVLLASQPGLFPPGDAADTDVFNVVLRAFGMEKP